MNRIDHLVAASAFLCSVAALVLAFSDYEMRSLGVTLISTLIVSAVAYLVARLRGRETSA